MYVTGRTRGSATADSTTYARVPSHTPSLTLDAALWKTNVQIMDSHTNTAVIQRPMCDTALAISW